MDIAIAIIKLGGSIITDKSGGRAVVQEKLLRNIAKRLRRNLTEFPRLRIILLHGAGSFGHPLVYRFGLANQPLNAQRLVGVGQTMYAMRLLGNHLTKIFTEAGLPIVPLQTSALVRSEDRGLKILQPSTFRSILKHRGVPLLSGDLVIDKHQRIIVASADELAVVLARHFRNSTILFATDVPGVYPTFPPREHAKPFRLINRRKLRTFIEQSEAPMTSRDVTGGMMGKLRALLALRHRTAIVFDGRKPELIREALSKKRHIGTTIKL